MEVNKTILFVIWTTSACNLRCKYCYEGNEKETHHMSTAVADDAVSFICKTMCSHPFHDVWIVFHGGEPCLNFPVVEYLIPLLRKKLANRHVSFSITTNATLLDSKKINFLDQNMDEITVSLDGTKCTHDRERIDANGQGTFDRAMATALLLNEVSDSLRVRMTVTPSNVTNLFSNIRFLIDCGFQTIVPAVDFFSETWTTELFDALEQQLLVTKEYLQYLGNPDVSVAMTDSDELQELGECCGAINEFHIYPNGDIYPCVYTVCSPEYICGNVKTGLDSNKIKAFKQLYSCRISQCEGCSYYKGCASTRCKFLNKALTGNALIPSPAVCLTQNACLSVYRHL